MRIFIEIKYKHIWKLKKYEVFCDVYVTDHAFSKASEKMEKWNKQSSCLSVCFYPSIKGEIWRGSALLFKLTECRR